MAVVLAAAGTPVHLACLQGPASRHNVVTCYLAVRLAAWNGGVRKAVASDVTHLAGESREPL